MNKPSGQRPKQQAILTSVLLTFVWGLLSLAGGWISPDLRRFFGAAGPWVLIGIGLAAFLSVERMTGTDGGDGENTGGERVENKQAKG